MLEKILKVIDQECEQFLKDKKIKPEDVKNNMYVMMNIVTMMEALTKALNILCEDYQNHAANDLLKEPMIQCDKLINKLCYSVFPTALDCLNYLDKYEREASLKLITERLKLMNLQLDVKKKLG